jgi:hypothetical protein
MRISFEEQFLDKMRDGNKTSTMRFGKRVYSECQELDVTCGSRFQKGGAPVVGMIRVLTVFPAHVYFNDYGVLTYHLGGPSLTPDQQVKLSKIEGFDSVNDMHNFFSRALLKSADKELEGQFIRFIFFTV